MDAVPRLPSATVLRYGGLAGSVVLAIAADRLGQRLIAIPAWLVGTGVLTGAWLLLGRRLAGLRLSWMLATAALWALPLLVSLPLESRDMYAYACQGSLVAHGVDPYTHGVASLPCPWLSEVPRVWRHTPSPYGSLWLLVSAAAASTHALVAAAIALRLVALAGVVLTGWAGHRLARALGVDPVAAAWLVLASPLLLVHGLSGAHNDALLTGLVVSAFALAVTGRPGLLTALAVGAIVGLAVSVKATAAVALPFAALLVSADRRWRSVLATGAAAVAGMVGAYGALWGLTGYGLGWLAALSNTTRFIVESTSLSTGFGLVAGRLLKLAGQPVLARHALTGFRDLGLVLLAGVLVALWWWARRQDARHVVLAAGLGMIATVVLAPVVFPWYALGGLAVLGYALVEDRWRWRTALLLAPVGLLILPNGNGIGALVRRPMAVVDVLVVLAVGAVVGWRHLRHRREVRAPVPAGRP